MKYVALLRVSTRNQVEGYGLDVQRAAVEDWAKKHRHRLVAVHVDEGISGTAPLTARPGLRAALAALAQDQADGLVVARLDRLSRDMVLQEQLYAEIIAMGARLASAVPTENEHLAHDPDDPTRALVRRILGAVAEYERQLIRLRLSNGQNRKRELGGYAAGAPPYGWTAVGGELVPVEAEQAIRRQMKAWHRAGWSTRRIATELTQRGIPTKNGGRWQSATIARIIKNSKRAILPGPSRGPVIGSGPVLGGEELPGNEVHKQLTGC